MVYCGSEDLIGVAIWEIPDNHKCSNAEAEVERKFGVKTL